MKQGSFLLCGLPFYLLTVINCFSFDEEKLLIFKESNLSIFSFTLEHYVAWLKYSLILGHEDVCLNYLLKLKKELTFGWLSSSCQTPDCSGNGHGTKMRFSQMICLLNNPAVPPFWSFSLEEVVSHQDSHQLLSLQLWISQNCTSTSQMPLFNWQIPHFSQDISNSVSPFCINLFLNTMRFLDYFSLKGKYRMP